MNIETKIFKDFEYTIVNDEICITQYIGDKVDVVINVIEEVCKKRKQVVSTQPGLSGENGMYMPFTLEVEVGGATVFVIDVDKFVKI